MPRTLSDEDIDTIACRVVQLMGTRLTTAETIQERTHPPTPSEPRVELKPKLAYSLAELCKEFSVSKATMYRLVYRGLLKPLPYLRTKMFTHKEVERFLDEGMEWDAGVKRRQPRR